MTAGPTDAGLFRSVLGHFCSGVTVVAGLGPDGPYGLTCQAFSSLSLDPPLVLFSAARTSTSWPRIRAVGVFSVNILAEHQEQVSVQMSRSGADKFAGVEWDLTPLGAPRLAGTAAWLDCTRHAEYDGGDHTIVVAAVHHLAAASQVRPLLFHRGRYATLDPNHRHPMPNAVPVPRG
jgi:3-hydroxy-9,10-secoandrosta-1,3,5(10)-triene-9,17-dione monooxygenase reductase component